MVLQPRPAHIPFTSAGTQLAVTPPTTLMQGMASTPVAVINYYYWRAGHPMHFTWHHHRETLTEL